jgi:hypothetical protein
VRDSQVLEGNSGTTSMIFQVDWVWPLVDEGKEKC